MNVVEQLVRSTLGQAWSLSIETPIGRKQSVLTFGCDDAQQLSGEMTDLFGTRLPLQELSISDEGLCWRLDVVRPIRVSVWFHARLEGSAVQGTVRSKYPDIPFTGRAPGA